MSFVINSSWAFLWSIIVHVFCSIYHLLWRFFNEKSVENVLIFDDLNGQSDEISVENEGEKIDDYTTITEKEVLKLETEVGNVCNSSTSKYQFIAGNSVCAFVEEPQTMNFTINEMFVSSHGDSLGKDDCAFDVDFRGFSIDLDDDGDDDDSFSLDLGVESLENDDDCGGLSGEKEVVKQGKTENSVCDDHGVEEQDVFNFIEDEMFEKDEIVDQSEKIVNNNHFSDEFQTHSTKLNDDDDLGVGSCSFEDGDGCGEVSGKEEGVKQGKTDSPVCDHGFEEQEVFSFNEVEICEKEEVIIDRIDEIMGKKQEVCSFNEVATCEKNEVVIDQSDEVMSEKDFSDDVRARSSISNSDDFWATIHNYDSFVGNIDEFDCDIDEVLWHKGFAEALEPKTPIGIGDIRVDYDHDDQYIPSSSDGSPIDHAHIESEHQNVESPYIELEPQLYSSSSNANEHHLSNNNVNSDSEGSECEEESTKLSDSKDVDDIEGCDGENEQVGNDVVLEQKELIRQMKREVRQLKISGLPTILEESESSRVEDDLRPLRIDERVGHKDRMDEIQTFYKRYLDKMRKLDTWSQQTMYAIGLLQLKSQDLALEKKVSIPAVKSLLAQNFWSNKLRKHDPVQKLLRELQRDLELVYVGQLCLSWEMLKWQHHKAEELQVHDPDGFRQHNHVAGEFQRFQVLLQRFTEDEPFHQGPRVQHYVKSRCNLLSLLQVPLVKDDPRSEWRRGDEDGISVKMLQEVIASSMRSFWDFLHADKDEVCAIPLMGIHGVHGVLQDPFDADLLTEIRSNLQKKEKRLKDLVKSGNCLVKKFKKHQDQKLNHETLVAQVELRLVSRVLSMPKLSTDQLLWCHKKLNKIDIIGRKIYLEYSFLLFPC